MANEQDTNGLLKIGELARSSGVSLSTVKYYVKEGLVEIAKKTSRNMAYYHPDSVRRVLLIRSLQKERFYPAFGHPPSAAEGRDELFGDRAV